MLTIDQFLSFVHPDDCEFVSDAWDAALTGAPYDIEHRIRRKDTEKWVREIAKITFDKDGKALHGVGTVQDITKLKNAEKALHEANKKLLDMAMQDGLTQIANRRSFDIRLKEEWRRMLRKKKSISLIIFDVDHFKFYNDTYGHQAGDICLRNIADKAAVIFKRPGDFLARYGGEEFAVILPDTTIEGAKLLAEEVCCHIHGAQIRHETSPVSNFVTISCGASSVIPNKSTSFQVLLEVADKALYCAKDQGRNRVITRELN